MRILLNAATMLAVGAVLWLGAYLEWQGVRNVVRASRSQGWPSTSGKVIGAETSRDTSTDRDTRQVHVTYSAKTVVQYRAAGRDYATNQIFFGQTLGSSDPSEAELQRLRYPPGAGVPVYYDPRQPWLAVLRPGLHAEAFSLPAAGLAFLLPGLVVTVMLPRIFGTWSGKPDRPGRDMGMVVAASVMAFIFTALGLLALGAGLRRMWNGHAAERWPTTLAEVVFSKVESSDTRDSDDTPSTTFSPSFVYRYEVHGVAHFNNLRRFGHIAGQGQDWAASLTARYPLGTRIPVAYSPADPDIAVLEPGNDSEALWLPGVGLFALLFGIAAFVWIVPGVTRD